MPVQKSLSVKTHRLPTPPSSDGTDSKPYWPANNQAERKQIEEESSDFQVGITFLFVLAVHGGKAFPYKYGVSTPVKSLTKLEE